MGTKLPTFSYGEKPSHLISIIVPVYNGELFISECISSILSQTVSYFELIVVDDGSVDGTVAKCVPFMNDPRFSLHSISNRGVTKAREYGFKQSHGQYILFVDADDSIQPRYLENFVNHIHENTQLICLETEERMLGPEEFIRQMLLYKAEWRIPEKMYLRSILEDSFFNISRRINIGEDLIANVSLLGSLRSIQFISPCESGDYIYRDNPFSVTHRRSYSLQYEEHFMTSLIEILDSKAELYSFELNLMRLRIWRILSYNGITVTHDSKIAMSPLTKKKDLQYTSIGNWLVLNVNNDKLLYCLLHLLQWSRRLLKKGDYIQ